MDEGEMMRKEIDRLVQYDRDEKFTTWLSQVLSMALPRHGT